MLPQLYENCKIYLVYYERHTLQCPRKKFYTHKLHMNRKNVVKIWGSHGGGDLKNTVFCSFVATR